MTMLADHWSEKTYLPEGNHRVAVAGVKFIRYNSGNQGAEYTLKNERGEQVSATFALVDTALWKLAQFASALGVTREDARQFDPMRLDHHSLLIGRECNVEVGKNGKYTECLAWWALDDAPPTPAAPAPATPAPEEDIPF
jgi:hypothetical protein